MSLFEDGSSKSPVKKSNTSESLYIKESFSASSYFEELYSYEPLHWINIPKLLQRVLNTMQKCMISSNKQLNEITSQVQILSLDHSKSINILEDSITSIRDTIKKTQNKAHAKLKESNLKLNAELLEIETKLTDDLEYKNKSFEARIKIAEDNVISMKKITNNLPSSEQIQGSIKYAVDSTMKNLKDEINKAYIKPVLNHIEKSLEDFKNNQTSMKKEIDKIQNNVEFQLNEINNNQVRNVATLVLNKVQEVLKEKLQDSEEKFKSKLRKNHKTIDALSESINEINYKYITDTHSMQSDIEEGKIRQAALQEELNKLKKEMHEIAQREVPKEAGGFLKPHTPRAHTVVIRNPVMQSIDPSNSISISPAHLPASFHAPSTAPIPVKSVNTNSISNPINISISSISLNRKTAPTGALRTANLISIPEPSSNGTSTSFDEVKNKTKLFNIKKSKPLAPSGKILEDLTIKILNIQKNVDKQLEEFKEKVRLEISDNVMPLEGKLENFRGESDFEFGDIKANLEVMRNDMLEVKEKLAWLPIHFAHVQDKPPSEARLFTLEARVRAEENARIQSFNNLVAFINSLKTPFVQAPEECSLPPIRTFSVLQEREFSHDSSMNSEKILFKHGRTNGACL